MNLQPHTDDSCSTNTNSNSTEGINMTDGEALLATPLSMTAGQPMRVAVYSRIAQGISSGVFAVGSSLPRETEIGAALNVSRTVVREALMLLEEDGLISTRRGVGRFVTASVPKLGLEGLRPFEQVLASPDSPVTVDSSALVLQPNTEFVADHLELEAEANAWFRESVLHRGGEPIAIVQEHLPAGRYLSDSHPQIAAALPRAAEDEATLLAGIQTLCQSTLSTGTCHITPSVIGSSRGRQLGLSESDPVLVLVQVAEAASAPVYLSKCIISSRVGHLTVNQTPTT